MSEEEKEQGTPEDTGEGDKPEAAGIVGEANKAREGLAKENERLEANIKELRELEAGRILGGETTGGTAPIKEKEVSPEDYAKLLLGGKLPLKD